MKRTINIKCDYNMVNYFTIYYHIVFKTSEERTLYKSCVGHGQWL